jgi:hypothetical protein
LARPTDAFCVDLFADSNRLSFSNLLEFVMPTAMLCKRSFWDSVAI